MTHLIGFRQALLLGVVGALASSFASIAGAQTIEVVGNPVQPGVPFSVSFTNTSSGWVSLSASPNLAMLQPTGELIVPEVVGCAPVATFLPPGATQTLSFTAPASGPGSAGSFVLLLPYGNGAVDRVDVGAASPGFPDLHTYPAGTPFNTAGHHVSFPPAQGLDWEIANTGDADHTFASGTLALFTPGGTAPVASLGLAGITVPAGGVARLALPLSGLAPGPYTVRAEWVDPATGAPTRVSHGIEAAPAAWVDLHFPGGKLVPRNGSIPARLTIRGLAPAFNSLGQPQGPLPTYWFVLGLFPGSTQVGGATVPLLVDPFVRASLNHGLFGTLQGHAGTTSVLGAYCAHRVDAFPAAGGITIDHPNRLAVSGLTLRAAVVALDSSGTYAASQPEEITYE